MASETTGKSVSLPGINTISNLSNRNLHSLSSSSNVLKSRDRAYSVDSSAGDSEGGTRIHASDASLSSRQLQQLFPYHISVDRDFNVVQLGAKLYPLVRSSLSPSASKKRLNQHISKYFRIVSPSSLSGCWDAKVLANLHIHASTTGGLLEIALVPCSPAHRNGGGSGGEENSLQAMSSRLLLRGRFHELTASLPSVIYEQESEGQEASEDGSGKLNEEASQLFLFLLYPFQSGATAGTGVYDDWSHASFAHIAAAAVPSAAVRTASGGDGGDTVAKLVAANAALVAENERLKEEAKGKDMRGMIGNVAHDLKTPLAAFMGGVELISDMAQECVTVLSNEQQMLAEAQAEINRLTPRTKTNIDERNRLVDGLRATLNSITQQAGGVRDINQFMTMTINRCIDYTKASQGIKLVPRNETIKLTEVLAMPINCMIASQSKVAFRLHPPPLDICTHIITDKIWLQENVLCLLSNAAKYSNAGRVDIQISLFPAQSLGSAATAAAEILAASTSGGSHKNENRKPTDNIMGALSPKQVVTIHNQRCDRATASAVAAAAAAATSSSSGAHGTSTPTSYRESRRNAARSGSIGSQPKRTSGSSVVSSSAKALSPVAPPYRQTISGPSTDAALAESAARIALGITIPPNRMPSPSNTPKTSGEALTPTPPSGESGRVPLGRVQGSSSKMESRPRSLVATDPLTQAMNSSSEDIMYSSSGSTATSPKSPLSPLNHSHNVPSAAVSQGAYAYSSSAPASTSLLSVAFGNANRNSTAKFRPPGGGSPSQSHPHSRAHSRSNSQSQSRNHSADVPDHCSTTSAHSAGISSPIAYIRSRMGKAEKLRHSVHQSFDQDDDMHSTANTVQEDIEAMALRGSFSSDGEGGDADERQSIYSESSSRQVSTDSRQYSTDSRRSFRFGSLDLTMGNLDDEDEESAKTVLSQHHLLYPAAATTGSLSYSPSSYSFLTANSYVANTLVEVHGGSNRPLQKMHVSSNSSATSSQAGGAAPSVESGNPPISAVPSPVVTPLLLIEISDTGIGLSDTNMNKLFSPFIQAQRLAGGTGLGLYSLSKRLDALGGHYGVECRKDGQPGSLFWFAIPYREDQDAASSFGKLQRSGSSRLQDLLMPAQPTTLKSMMAVAEVNAELHGTAEPREHVFTGAAKSPKSTGEQSATHSLHCSSQSSKNSLSTRSSLTSIVPLHPDSHSHAVTSSVVSQCAENIASASLSSVPMTPVGLAAGAPMHFLLVDDSESILKVTSMLLTRSGHTVERAENGVIALDKISASQMPGGRAFDVVVMDLQMPVLDGLEATKRLREIEDEAIAAAEIAADTAAEAAQAKGGNQSAPAPAMPRRQVVIGLSANGDEDTEQAAYAAGVDRFIEKPFTIQKLLDALAEIQGSEL